MSASTYIPAVDQEQIKDRQKIKHTSGLSKIVINLDMKNEVINEKKPSENPSEKPSKRRRTSEIPVENKPQPRILQLFPELLSKIFVDYKEEIKFVYREWIPYKKIEQVWLCANTNIAAIEILTEVCRTRGPDYLDWKELCRNPNALPLIEQYRNFIEYEELAYNSKAYDLLIDTKENNPENFHWGNFSANSKAGLLITDKSLDEAEMTEDEYMGLHDFEKLDWAKVSSNRSTYIINFLIKTVPFRINMGTLSGNPNPMAITVLTQRIEDEKILEMEDLGAFEELPYNQKIDWFLLSENYSAIPLLEANENKIRWDTIGANENARRLIQERIIIEEGYEKEEREEDIREREREKDIYIMKKLESLTKKLLIKKYKKSMDQGGVNDKAKLKEKKEINKLIKDLLKKEKSNKDQGEINELINELLKISKSKEKSKSQEEEEKKKLINNLLEKGGVNELLYGLSFRVKELQNTKKKDKQEPNNRLNWSLICANRKLLNLVEIEYKKNNNKIESRLAYLAANPSIFILSKGGPYTPAEDPTRFKTSSDKILR